MNLQLLTSPLPKDLNVSFNSITTNKTYQLTPVQDLVTSPVTLTAAHYVNNRLFGHDSVGTVNVPNASELKDYFGTVPVNFSFSVYLYKSTAVSFNVVLGTGVTEYRLNTGTIALTSGSPNAMILSYVYVGAGAWVVYY